MIKAKATLKDERPLYLFGLSAKNIEKLREGLAIRIDLKEMGGHGVVMIMFGETEASIAAELSDLIGPETTVRGVAETGH